MNFMTHSKIAGLLLAITMTSVGGAAAYADQTNTGRSGAVLQTAAITPLSMQFFCAKNRNECRGGGSAQVGMTPNMMMMLKQVNVHVNRSIRPKVDSADIWNLNPTEGDCEDYVLSKRSMLIKHGVSAGALRIAYTHTRRGEPHAVLVVKTSQGDYVLDNLNNSVKTLRASGYNIRTMSTANPRSWSAG
ncbi:putative transglutaminase-like cysteine proteinase [Devosia subaequoris]|uniref:Putative transglutaminase-like cysteine proteinase n=1 Tax=Devosia subaequoris TaxID=395930 RepID=A0A7W6ND36_9HYPH|nr:transglutaminase-like cysteine peptidase [Devosia subaequoris]MBB4053772.1 putative transglutaminase-like cysteine proteinase [Devosia subaequoris]MCP1211030.1 transglutaminase-like cysteine peptidase [Devosia subaequoris]